MAPWALLGYAYVETYITSFEINACAIPGTYSLHECLQGRLEERMFHLLHMFCRCDRLSSSLHKNGVNYAASQSVKVAHNQGGPETDGGFAKKWERTKHKQGRTHQPRSFRCQVCGKCRKSCDSTQVSSHESWRFYFCQLLWSNMTDTAPWSVTKAKRPPFENMTPRTKCFDCCCGLFFNHRVESFTSS